MEFIVSWLIVVLSDLDLSHVTERTKTYEMNPCAFADFAASKISSSLASGFPNEMFSRMVPEKSTGS